MIGDAVLGLIAGFAIGVFFFGGLAWTVGRLARSRWPALLFMTSLALRATVSIAVLTLLARTGWVAFAAGVTAFVVVRVAIIWIGRSRVGLAGED